MRGATASSPSSHVLVKSQGIHVSRFVAYRFVLALCIVATPAWVAFHSGGKEGFIWAILFVGTAATLFAIVAKERQVAADSLMTEGTVVVRRSRRGGSSIDYRFMSSTGQEHAEESVSVSFRTEPGSVIPIVYCTYDPTMNMPLRNFLFYTFEKH